MTEYQTSFKQFSPCYVAVAAMKPGNEPEIGKVHELFLDWKSTPPRPPDDVMVLDHFQAFDGKIPEGSSGKCVPSHRLLKNADKLLS